MENLIEKAKELLKYVNDGAYVMSKMYASRNGSTSLRMIDEAIKEAKNQLNLK